MSNKKQRIEAARIAGSATSERKAVKARENGSRGGRPPEWLRTVTRKIGKDFSIEPASLAKLTKLIHEAWKQGKTQS